MRHFSVVVMCGVSLALAGLAQAQAPTGEIVVTGNRISGEDYSRMPAVTIEKRADFLVQEIRLTNDTRDADARRNELYQTIRDMVADASKKPGMALGYGDEFLIPITAQDYEIPLSSGGQRPDTNYTHLYVKVALGPNDDVSKALQMLTSFIAKARVTGRTEIDPEDELALSLVNPERYRYEIIEQISADAKMLQAAIGSHCRVAIFGLANRVSWQRSDVSQLTLYIPYQVELAECQ